MSKDLKAIGEKIRRVVLRQSDKNVLLVLTRAWIKLWYRK